MRLVRLNCVVLCLTFGAASSARADDTDYFPENCGLYAKVEFAKMWASPLGKEAVRSAPGFHKKVTDDVASYGLPPEKVGRIVFAAGRLPGKNHESAVEIFTLTEAVATAAIQKNWKGRFIGGEAPMKVAFEEVKVGDVVVYQEKSTYSFDPKSPHDGRVFFRPNDRTLIVSYSLGDLQRVLERKKAELPATMRAALGRVGKDDTVNVAIDVASLAEPNRATGRKQMNGIQPGMGDLFMSFSWVEMRLLATETLEAKLAGGSENQAAAEAAVKDARKLLEGLTTMLGGADGLLPDDGARKLAAALKGVKLSADAGVARATVQAEPAVVWPMLKLVFRSGGAQ